MSAAHLSLGNTLLEQVYSAKTPEESRQAYEQWAASYDADITAQGYIAPQLCAEAVAKHGGIEGPILDAGCGTGFVGVELSKLGARAIDGIDLSEGMMKVAEKANVYRKLEKVDLSKTLDKADAEYNAVVCVGTFTQGHVGPEPALPEFARVTKSGGVIVATILDNIWKSGGYEASIQQLVKDGKVDLVSNELSSYRTKATGHNGRILILKKL